MAIKWKKSSIKGIALILAVAAAASTLMCNLYPLYRENAERIVAEEKAEDAAAVESAENGKNFKVDEEFERYMMSTIYYMNYEATPDMSAYEYFTQDYDTSRLSQAEINAVNSAAGILMKNMRNQYATEQEMNPYHSFVVGVDRNFGADPNLKNIIYGRTEFPENCYDSGIVIRYDSRGIPSIKNSWNVTVDESALLRYLNSATVARLMEDNGMDREVIEVRVIDQDGEEVTMEDGEIIYTNTESVSDDTVVEYAGGEDILKAIPLPQIKNTSFAFGVNKGTYNHDEYYDNYRLPRRAFEQSGFIVGVLLLILIMTLLSLVVQNIPALGVKNSPLFHWPTELVVLFGSIGFVLTGGWVIYGDWGYYTAYEDILRDFQVSLGLGSYAQTAVLVFVWLFWFAFCLCYYWLAASIWPYIAHPIRSLKEHLLLCSICRWLKKQWLRLWNWATDVTLDSELSNKIWKIVAVNGLIVAVLCCTWFGGIVGAIVYSILLYVLVKKKTKEVTDDYEKLLGVTHAMAEGELNVSTDEDMGLFNPMRDELKKIRNGFQKAVHEEVKSRNMRTELITNVSHDLKTPLTAIITYVDLLKDENLTEEQRRDYIATLDKKSQRLKVLIEDLFEVSKATTSTITMNYEDVDLVSLIKEVRVENEDKILDSTLDIRWDLPLEKCILSLDPQRTYRIIDNLLQNILKYSMPHSRVYIQMKDEDGMVTITMKNMSANEMNFSPEEITQRFVRGDLSRNTEGSGLGLAIAQSFTELQNGSFHIEIDGDLFKVIIGWKK